MWKDYSHFCLQNTMCQMLCKPLTFHLILKTSYEVGTAIVDADEKSEAYGVQVTALMTQQI